MRACVQACIPHKYTFHTYMCYLAGATLEWHETHTHTHTHTLKREMQASDQVQNQSKVSVSWVCSCMRWHTIELHLGAPSTYWHQQHRTDSNHSNSGHWHLRPVPPAHSKTQVFVIKRNFERIVTISRLSDVVRKVKQEFQPTAHLEGAEI